MDKKTILITGINGFLGSSLAKEFVKDYNIVGLEISTENLWRIAGLEIPVYAADEKGLNEVFNNHTVDIIIYAATLYGRNGESLQLLLEANCIAPFNLLNKAIDNNVKCFINTDTVLDRYTSTYSLTKKQFKDWLLHRQKEIKVVNMPLEHFYGPECPETNFISIMAKRLKNNELKIDLTKGEPLRNFVFFSDLIDAYKLVVDRLDSIQEDFSEFEVSTQELISIKDLMIKLKTLTQSETELNFGAVPYRPNELMKSIVDNSKLVEFGWNPKVTIDEGLEKIVANLN